MRKTITVTVDVDPNEEMFSVGAVESESGCSVEFGPTPLWSDWRDALKDAIGNEIVSWVELMSDCNDEEE